MQSVLLLHVSQLVYICTCSFFLSGYDSFLVVSQTTFIRGLNFDPTLVDAMVPVGGPGMCLNYDTQCQKFKKKNENLPGICRLKPACIHEASS